MARFALQSFVWVVGCYVRFVPWLARRLTKKIFIVPEVMKSKEVHVAKTLVGYRLQQY